MGSNPSGSALGSVCASLCEPVMDSESGSEDKLAASQPPSNQKSHSCKSCGSQERLGAFVTLSLSPSCFSRQIVATQAKTQACSLLRMKAFTGPATWRLPQRSMCKSTSFLLRVHLRLRMLIILRRGWDRVNLEIPSNLPSSDLLPSLPVFLCPAQSAACYLHQLDMRIFT